jgi:hypothetical protein
MLTKIDIHYAVGGGIAKGNMKSRESTTEMVFTTAVFEVAIVSACDQAPANDLTVQA